MTTQAWSFPISHASDADFRTWGADFSAKLAAVGMVQAGDTGQINWATVTRPGTNTDGGYEIWRFDDAAQATAPIFIKFYYGTGSSTGIVRFRAEMGTGSNGSGTLTGTATGFAVRNIGSAGQGTYNGTSRDNYMVHAEGFFAFAWGIGAPGTNFSGAGMAICRTCDSDGVPTDKGALVLLHNNSGSSSNADGISIRYAATATTYGVGSALHGFIPGARSSKLTTTNDQQVFVMWIETPEIEPAFGFALCLSVNITDFDSFSTALVGTTPRTYLSLGGSIGVHGAPQAASPKLCILWE